ncbi:hypothetical protein [Sphingomonas crocodyli]|nr:hypothetical protein [Sphingomonas crocodyli]
MSEPHDCFAKVDAMLAERNTRLTFPIVFSEDMRRKPMIVTEQIETGRGKKKAVGMFATFCPFCGASLAKASAS